MQVRVRHNVRLTPLGSNGPLRLEGGSRLVIAAAIDIKLPRDGDFDVIPRPDGLPEALPWREVLLAQHQARQHSLGGAARAFTRPTPHVGDIE